MFLLKREDELAVMLQVDVDMSMKYTPIAQLLMHRSLPFIMTFTVDVVFSPLKLFA